MAKRSAAVGTTTDPNQSPRGKHRGERRRRAAFSKWANKVLCPESQHSEVGQTFSEPKIDALQL